MIKKTIQYKDFNDKNQTEVLYFNVSASELMDHLDLRDEIEVIEASLEGPERELTTAEIQRLLDLVKRLIKMSYGRRSEDGSRFRKNEEIFDDFKSSAVYDEFIMSLFRDPEQAFDFIVAVMPQELVEAARKERLAMEGDTPVENVELPSRNVFEQANAATDDPEPAPEEDTRSDWREFSEDELLIMEKPEFERLYNKIKGPKPGVLVSIAMKRKAHGL